MASLTWLGHGSFRVDTNNGKRIYVDPFKGPTWPEAEDTGRADAILVTHGHGDHTANVAEIQQQTGAKVACINELAAWFSRNGVPEDAVIGFNKGGTVEVGGSRVTMTNALHSSSSNEGEYTGDPAGLIVRADGRTVYFAGDTSVFGDMALIARLYEPDVAVLPIGDHFTMGPSEAALALELLGNPRCVPCHYGTWPPLVGRPAELKKLTSAEIVDIEPGGSIDL